MFPSRTKEYKHKHYLANKDRYKQWGLRWRTNNLEKYKAAARQAYYRRIAKKYGTTLEHINFLKEKQHNSCAICGQVSKLLIDHDHITNQFRGLLCDDCNKLLGLAKDNTKLLESAIQYLEDFNGR